MTYFSTKGLLNGIGMTDFSGAVDENMGTWAPAVSQHCQRTSESLQFYQMDQVPLPLEFVSDLSPDNEVFVLVNAIGHYH
jgi:hypothetical protein